MIMKRTFPAMLLVLFALSVALPTRSEAHGGGGWWLPAFVGGMIFGSAIAGPHAYAYPPPVPAYPPPAPVYVYPLPPRYVYPPMSDPDVADAAPQGEPATQEPVTEGSFAVKLVTALKLGAAQTEMEAEDKLAAVGIIPKTGWIADFPMTPAIIDDLRAAVTVAAAAKKIPLDRDAAQAAFERIIAAAGSAATPANPALETNAPPAQRAGVGGSWVRVPGQWIDGRWVPPHRAWSPASR
jgi:hypothetical protein